jgi:hypothetical protein
VTGKIVLTQYAEAVLMQLRREPFATHNDLADAIDYFAIKAQDKDDQASLWSAAEKVREIGRRHADH